MTEEEAKTKMCHRTFGTHDAAVCIGSACMAWRIEMTEASYSAVTGERLKPRTTYASSVVEKRKEVIGGFCGLAGKP